LDISVIEIPGLKLLPYEFETKTTQFDLTLTGSEAGEKILFTFEYSTRLFKKETIARFINYFKHVVSSIMENPDQKLKKIEIIPEAEKELILQVFNDTEAEYPGNKTIQQLFAEQAAKIPDNTALQSPQSVHLTYRELNEKANRLALILIEKGVKPGIIAALMTGRSVEMIVSLLAILKAGGAYLPIDPEYPEQRITYMLADSRAEILVATRPLAKKVDELISSGIETVFAEESGPSVGVRRAVPSELLAYIIYTSGSTGNPKGVAISQRNVVNFIKGMSERIDFSPGKTILALTTISFDIFVLETILPLVLSLKILIAGEEEQRDPVLLRNLIRKNRVQMLQVTPSRLKLLSSSDEELACLKDVAELMVGGEAFPDNLFALVKEKYRGKIYNMYGPTETTVWSAVKDLTGIEEINIGRPIANTRIYILDRSYKLQPIGITGELCIGGDGLGRGYLNQPELTAEKFITAQAASFKPQASTSHKPQRQAKTHQLTHSSTHSLVYRTGDLARWLPDGNIEFLGRFDSQVKIRGFRIELGEIENELLKHKDIKEAVVFDRQSDNGDEYLCAYLVANIVGARRAVPLAHEQVVEFAREPDEKITPAGSHPVSGPGTVNMPDTSELRRLLSQNLPYYMIPAYFVFLEKMPLTPNGKIDRKALPAPEGFASAGGLDYVPPHNEVEAKLVENWEEILDRKPVGVNDNFFLIGGDSVKFIHVASRMNRSGYKIEIRDMFLYPSVAALAPRVKKARTVYSEADQFPVTGIVPLTPIQADFFSKPARERFHFNQSVML
ncbi:MAG: non-ribosomal peptide synthetase, partial [Planctomycetota bacterium]